MTPRKFAIGLMIAAGALFFGTALANVLIDPVAVFGTDLFPRRHPNYRYLGVRDYQVHAKSVDALFFASSRGYSLEQPTLAKAMGAHELHDQAAPYGLISDHLPVLEYILRDKASRGEKVKSVFLMLDTDLFGRAPWTNVNIDCFLPPEVTGESRVRFWWRYLTAVQITTWKDGIKGALSKEKNIDPRFNNFGGAIDGLDRMAALRRSSATALRLQSSLPDISALIFAKAHAEGVSGNVSPAANRAADPAERFRSYWITKRPDIERQFAMVEIFVRLCRENGIALTIATTPLQRSNIDMYRPGELDAIGARLNRITDIWDFATPGPFTDNPNVWVDYAHFKVAVGTMMIARIFGGDTPVSAGFGKFKPKTVQ
ncbi:MAG: hypothetical protein HY242_01955 [Afipia sp.]|nr:hypothetical protein [Afipia sp.]